jgi:hypothetical protein
MLKPQCPWFILRIADLSSFINMSLVKRWQISTQFLNEKKYRTVKQVFGRAYLCQLRSPANAGTDSLTGTRNAGHTFPVIASCHSDPRKTVSLLEAHRRASHVVASTPVRTAIAAVPAGPSNLHHLLPLTHAMEYSRFHSIANVRRHATCCSSRGGLGTGIQVGTGSK